MTHKFATHKKYYPNGNIWQEFQINRNSEIHRLFKRWNYTNLQVNFIDTNKNGKQHGAMIAFEY